MSGPGLRDGRERPLAARAARGSVCPDAYKKIPRKTPQGSARFELRSFVSERVVRGSRGGCPQGSLETAQGCRRSGGAALPAQQPCCRAGLPCCQRRAAGLPAQGCAVTGRAAGCRRPARGGGGSARQPCVRASQPCLAGSHRFERAKGEGAGHSPRPEPRETGHTRGCRAGLPVPRRAAAQGCRAGLPRRAAAQGCRAVALLPRRAAGKRAQGCRERPAGLPAAVRRAAMLPAQGCLAGSPESVQGCRGGSAGLPARQP